MNGIQHACSHSCFEHIFEFVHCDDLNVLERIGIVFFHIVTLCIPLALYHLVSYFYPSGEGHVTSLSNLAFPNASPSAEEAIQPKDEVLETEIGIYLAASRIVKDQLERDIREYNAKSVELLLRGLILLKEQVEKKPLKGPDISPNQESCYRQFWENNLEVREVLDKEIDLLEKFESWGNEERELAVRYRDLIRGLLFKFKDYL